MKYTGTLAIGALLVAIGGCSAESEPGQGEPAPAVDDAAKAQSALQACGKDTVASIVDGDNRRLTFCVSERGREVVIEVAPEGVASALPAEGARLATAPERTSALQLFLAHTPATTAVPHALVESAARRGLDVKLETRTISQVPVIEQDRVAAGASVKPQTAGGSLITTNSAYCNGQSGQLLFQQNICFSPCGSDTDCQVSVCTPNYWSSSYRWWSEADLARYRIVSCGGWTHVVADARDDSSSPWVTGLDTWIARNQVWSFWINDGPSDWTDSDLRFRAWSDPGASHQHSFKVWD